MNRAQQAWEQMKAATAYSAPSAIAVSPELYFEQVEYLQEVNSAYTSTDPEVGRLPWLAIEGVPVIVNAELGEDEFTLITSRDFIDDMRLALDIYTDGMLTSKPHRVQYGGSYD